MAKNNCENCACSVSGTYCTKQKNVSESQYKNCDGWMAVVKKTGSIHKEKKSQETLTQREERIAKKFELGTNFSRFLVKGGHYSFISDKDFIINGEN